MKVLSLSLIFFYDSFSITSSDTVSDSPLALSFSNQSSPLFISPCTVYTKVEEKNRFALNVLKRVRVKLEGREPDSLRKV